MGNVFQDAKRVAVTRRNAILRTYSEIMLRFDAPHDDDAGKLLDLMREIPLDENAVRSDVMSLQEIRGAELVLVKLQAGMELLSQRLASAKADLAAIPKTAAGAGLSGSEFKAMEIDKFRAERFVDEIEQRLAADTFQSQHKQEFIRQAKLNTPRVFGVKMD
jgi:hypothetical protein